MPMWHCESPTFEQEITIPKKEKAMEALWAVVSAADLVEQQHGKPVFCVDTKAGLNIRADIRARKSALIHCIGV